MSWMFWPEIVKACRGWVEHQPNVRPCMPGGTEALTEYRTYASFYDNINWPFATQTEAVRNTLVHNPAQVPKKSKEFV